MDYTLSGIYPNSGFLEIQISILFLIWDSVTTIVHFKCYELNTWSPDVGNCRINILR